MSPKNSSRTMPGGRKPGVDSNAGRKPKKVIPNAAKHPKDRADEKTAKIATTPVHAQPDVDLIAIPPDDAIDSDKVKG